MANRVFYRLLCLKIEIQLYVFDSKLEWRYGKLLTLNKKKCKPTLNQATTVINNDDHTNNKTSSMPFLSYNQNYEDEKNYYFDVQDSFGTKYRLITGNRFCTKFLIFVCEKRPELAFLAFINYIYQRKVSLIVTV